MISEATGSRSGALTGRLSYLDTGSSNARIRIYGGTRAALVTSAPAAAPLVEITLTKPAGAVSSGALNLTGAGEATVNNSGTATWARVVNGNGDTAFDMDVGATGDSAECILSEVSLFSGGAVLLLTATLG